MRFDLTLEDLEEKVLKPYDEGREIVMGGRSVPTNEVERIQIFETDTPSSKLDEVLVANAKQGVDWTSSRTARIADVTEKFIDRPAGTKSVARPPLLLLLETLRPYGLFMAAIWRFATPSRPPCARLASRRSSSRLPHNGRARQRLTLVKF
jgi:hypothetical protein